MRSLNSVGCTPRKHLSTVVLQNICSWEISKRAKKSYTMECIFEHNYRLLQAWSLQLYSKMYSIVYGFLTRFEIIHDGVHFCSFASSLQLSSKWTPLCMIFIEFACRISQEQIFWRTADRQRAINVLQNWKIFTRWRYFRLTFYMNNEIFQVFSKRLSKSPRANI